MHAALVRFDIRYVHIQRIHDLYGCFLIVCVLVIDLIDNLVAYAHQAQFACAYVRRGLLLLGYRILNRLEGKCRIMIHLYCCALVDNAAEFLTISRFFCSRQDLHFQRHIAFVSRCHILQRPRHFASCRFAAMASFGAAFQVCYVCVQRIHNGYCRFSVFIVPVINLIGNLVTYAHQAKFARTYIR